MTIVVSIRVNDGIVLAADSATSFMNQQGMAQKVYNNANKIFNLVKVWPIGAMTYGAGSIGPASISTLSKDFRERLTPPQVPQLESESELEYVLDPENYTIEEVALKAKKFFFDECYKQEYTTPIPGYFLGYRLCGYSSNGTLPEAWEIKIFGDQCHGPERIYEPDNFGPRWAGETEALDRLILGLGTKATTALQQIGLEEEKASQVTHSMVEFLYQPLFLPAMPIQDAIDLAAFLVETAAKFSHFSLAPATVGGPVEIATITKHEGFKWIARKHYYSVDFNLEG